MSKKYQTKRAITTQEPMQSSEENRRLVDEHDPIPEEVKKYRSAEEFVRAKIDEGEGWYQTIVNRNGLKYHNNIQANSRNDAIKKALSEFSDYAERKRIDCGFLSEKNVILNKALTQEQRVLRTEYLTDFYNQVTVTFKEMEENENVKI